MSRVIAKVRRARFGAGITFKMPKMFVPVDCQVPTTAKQLVARQLYQAGLISKTDFEQMLGVLSAGEYDGDYNTDSEDYSDEAFQPRTDDYEQSAFASYEDFEDIAPESPVRNDVQPDKAAIPVSDNPESAPEPKDGDTK